MGEALATKQSLEYDRKQIDLIKQTVAKGATDLELKLFLHQCARTGLDPLSRQIHFIKRWNAKANKDEGAIQTGIDGYRVIADRTGEYAGSDDAVFAKMNSGEKYPEFATVTVWKMVAGQRCSFAATARWSEYYPGDDHKGFFWRKMPYGQLAKCAEALALRKAFPQQLSGIYTNEEMDQAQGTFQGTKEDQKAVADAKIAELKVKIEPPGKSAEDFAKEHPPQIEAVIVPEKAIVEVTGVIGQLSPVRETKAKNKYHTVMVGEQEVYVFDSKLWPQLKSMTSYETAVRCEKKAVGERVIYTMIGFAGIPEEKVMP